MILIPAKYAEIALGFDSIMLIMSLLFRKPKGWKERSTLDRKSIKRLGYYLVISAIALLVLNHYAFYTNYLDYFEGLMVDAFFFYLGLRAVIQNE
ncbi:B94 [Sulfolobus spindle-shaped virus Lassen]|nr:B94 [Sulfolobus spindle-shaped virus Lassen]